jgi:hypothetical protein
MKGRAGAYKKILIDFETLKVHGDYLRANVEILLKLNLPHTDFTTLYLLLFLRIKHPKNWLQKKNKASLSITDNLVSNQLLLLIPESFKLNDWEIQKLKGLTAIELFSYFNLKAVPESINRTMLNWYRGIWSIVCLMHIPSPRELLKLQVKNTRCITVITDPLKIDSLILKSRDPLSFLLHDLMHADQFFSQHESLVGQLGFYYLIDSIYDRSELKTILKKDLNFKKEFEYISSDMNAYVIHLFKCLKSSIFRTDEHEDFFNLLLNWWKMNEDQKRSSNLLNTPSFTFEHEMILKNFFESHQELYL